MILKLTGAHLSHCQYSTVQQYGVILICGKFFCRFLDSSCNKIIIKVPIVPAYIDAGVLYGSFYVDLPPYFKVNFQSCSNPSV